jgi:hypothetical protein
MTKRNLVTALAAALDGKPGPVNARGTAPDNMAAAAQPQDGDGLLSALRNSTTGCDQIMQRRLGALLDTPIT